MSRQARIQSPTDYYHVMMRGNNRESIFGKDEQKKLFLKSLKMQSDDQLIDIVAYCLMDNHVHIVAKADMTDLSKAIKCINIKYAMSFNQRRDRIGHVFQDRFKSETINDDRYLMQVIRYIHNNPVAAKMAKSPGDYNWSSYNEYMSENIIIHSQQKEFILGCFSYDIEQFLEFHKQKDNNEYLEIKEVIENERLEQAQDIISIYFEQKGLIDAKQVINNSVHLEEIIRYLLKGSRLTHRQIANLLGVSNNVVHKVNLHKD
ncbi:MAG TPA: transposase [Patescibacteria group bacterium]|nr:transposase [Patescibacteria group bacterium]